MLREECDVTLERILGNHGSSSFNEGSLHLNLACASCSCLIVDDGQSIKWIERRTDRIRVWYDYEALPNSQGKLRNCGDFTDHVLDKRVKGLEPRLEEVNPSAEFGLCEPIVCARCDALVGAAPAFRPYRPTKDTERLGYLDHVSVLVRTQSCGADEAQLVDAASHPVMDAVGPLPPPSLAELVLLEGAVDDDCEVCAGQIAFSRDVVMMMLNGKLASVIQWTTFILDEQPTLYFPDGLSPSVRETVLRDTMNRLSFKINEDFNLSDSERGALRSLLQVIARDLAQGTLSIKVAEIADDFVVRALCKLAMITERADLCDAVRRSEDVMTRLCGVVLFCPTSRHSLHCTCYPVVAAELGGRAGLDARVVHFLLKRWPEELIRPHFETFRQNAEDSAVANVLCRLPSLMRKYECAGWLDQLRDELDNVKAEDTASPSYRWLQQVRNGDLSDSDRVAALQSIGREWTDLAGSSAGDSRILRTAGDAAAALMALKGEQRFTSESSPSSLGENFLALATEMRQLLGHVWNSFLPQPLDSNEAYVFLFVTKSTIDESGLAMLLLAVLLSWNEYEIPDDTLVNLVTGTGASSNAVRRLLRHDGKAYGSTSYKVKMEQVRTLLGEPALLSIRLEEFDRLCQNEVRAQRCVAMEQGNCSMMHTPDYKAARCSRGASCPGAKYCIYSHQSTSLCQREEHGKRCLYYERGSCSFYHSPSYKPNPCHAFQRRGDCQYGDNCYYSHDIVFRTFGQKWPSKGRTKPYFYSNY